MNPLSEKFCPRFFEEQRAYFGRYERNIIYNFTKQSNARMPGALHETLKFNESDNFEFRKLISNLCIDSPSTDSFILRYGGHK